MPLGKVLVSGGAGYIGSHTCLALLSHGFDVVVLDSLVNSSKESLLRVEELSGRRICFLQGDVRDTPLLRETFRAHQIFAVMHFAGLKAVGESTQKPLLYYDVNVGGTVSLCQAMQESGVFTLIFSSSATVYGDPLEVPIAEVHPTGNTTNPYGRSKYMVEKVLQDLGTADPHWNIALLRYFNPVGAHESGRIGEDPKGVPNNLLPYICQVAVGRREYLQVFGNDYPTEDGTGVRDYIHVMDLAEGHVAALRAINPKLGRGRGLHAWNLGTGRGYSVLQMVSAFEDASGRRIPYKILPRRQGDVAESYADPAKAHNDLGWFASRDLDTMMRDAWRWQSQNPDGYVSSTPINF